MKRYYSIGEMAKLGYTTIATLRHYDQIGLLTPAKVDHDSGYRYYTDNELIYLHVITFCKQRKMSLDNIREVFKHDRFEFMIPFLEEKEAEIDQEVRRLQETQGQIRVLKERFTFQLSKNQAIAVHDDYTEKWIEERAIIKIEELSSANIENFDRMFDVLDERMNGIGIETSNLVFDQSAHLMTKYQNDEAVHSCIFAQLIDPTVAYHPYDFITTLPSGMHISTYVSTDQIEISINQLRNYVRGQYDTIAHEVIQRVVFTGMFQWKYELQVYIGK